ncbi:hypothetical protein [Neptunicella marina]|uniref:Uncharacterized protein n=1 Tax=Neptunicella marina TaxID=2125989 RepID=A0A8J6IUW5_9ALTE|nr:hypothetical protein [Neptunicella marina]MBC3766212.1 hypothetical protein [Neptunicella marina]
MKNVLLILFAFISGNAFALNNCAIPEGKSTGKPAIRVIPSIPLKSIANEAILDGDCTLVSYKLKIKKDTMGKGLVPYDFRIEATTNNTLTRQTISALEGWLYFAKWNSTHKRYYYSFTHKEKGILKKKELTVGY